MKTFKMLLSSLAVAALVTTVACKKDDKTEGKTDDKAAAKATDKAADKTPATKTPDTKAAPPSADGVSNEKKAEMALKFMGDMSKALTDNKGDCTKMAGALTKVIEDNKDLMAKSKEWDKDPAFKKWFEETHKDKMMAAVGPMMEAGTACKDDEGFKAAMGKMR